jgi:hypothetical protein
MSASIDLDERRRRAKEAVQEARGAGVELVTLAERPWSPAASGGQPAAAAAVAPPADPPAAPTRPAVQAAVAPAAHAARAEPAPAPQVPSPAPVGYVPRRASFYQEGKGAERLAPSGADLVPLTVMVPNYLLRQIEQAIAMNQGISKRFVVTDALSRAGFMVKPEDLVEDGRRKRRKT